MALKKLYLTLAKEGISGEGGRTDYATGIKLKPKL